MKPTLHQLRVFHTVASLGSFTRASEALHLTQPAVSIQVKQLENVIGLPLHEHVGKRFSLTGAGHAVFLAAKEVRDRLDDLGEEIAELKGLKRGRLKVSVATTAGYFATRMLAGFARSYPEVSISLDVTNRERLLAQLENNERDLVIMGEPPAGKDLEFQPFLDNPLVIIAAAGHELAGAEQISLEALRGRPFVVREPGSGTRAALERVFAENEITVASVMELSDNESIKQAVQAGLGLAVASRHTLDMELQTGRIVILSVQGFPIVRHWYLAKRTGKQLSPIAQLFEAFVMCSGGEYSTL